MNVGCFCFCLCFDDDIVDVVVVVDIGVVVDEELGLVFLLLVFEDTSSLEWLRLYEKNDILCHHQHLNW